MLCDIYTGNCCGSESACTDVLLIDYNMPRMTGLEFIELMSRRGCKVCPAAKIIMSGDTTAIDMERVKQQGCQVVQKPFSFAASDKTILQIIETIKLKRDSD